MPMKHWMNSLNYTREKQTVSLYGDVTIAAAGAPTLVAANSKGITSIVRNSAGNYTVTFDDTYSKYLSFWVGYRVSGGSAPAAPTNMVKTVVLNTAGTATVNFVCFSGATPTDPASGEELFIEATFGATSAF